MTADELKRDLDFIEQYIRQGKTYKEFTERLFRIVSQFPPDAYNARTRKPHEVTIPKGSKKKKQPIDKLHSALGELLNDSFALQILSIRLRATQADSMRRTQRIIPEDCPDFDEVTRTIIQDLIRATDTSKQKTDKHGPQKAVAIWISWMIPVYTEFTGLDIPESLNEKDPFLRMCVKILKSGSM